MTRRPKSTSLWHPRVHIVAELRPPGDASTHVVVGWSSGRLEGERLERYTIAFVRVAEEPLRAIWAREEAALPDDSTLLIDASRGFWSGLPRRLGPEVQAAVLIAQARALAEAGP